MNQKTEKIKRKYDRFSHIFDFFENSMGAASNKSWRLEMMKELKGKVLEVGVRTGKI